MYYLRHILIKHLIFILKKKIKKNRLHDVKDINIKFFKNRKKVKINKKRLKEIESKYSRFSSLNQQIISGQYTSTAYHDRFYYRETTYEENLYWLILNYDKSEKLLNSLNPDYIFDLDSSEIQRTIINEISHHYGIPYINIEYSRYESYLIPTFNLGLRLDKYFIIAYIENQKNRVNDNFKEIVKLYKKNKFIMPKIYKNDITSSYDFSFITAIKSILSEVFFSLRNLIYLLINNSKLPPINSPMYSNPFKRCIWGCLYSFRRAFFLSKYNKYFCDPIDEHYVYLPLHLIPESSTFVKAPMHVNELSLIEAVSKTLPINWKLYVKEHQAMLGQRSTKFYKSVKRLHNTKLIKTNFYKDPKPLIEKSLAVVTITGSAAFEAAMLNKPSIVFGNSCYNVIPSVKVAKSFADLEIFFNSINNKKFQYDNVKDCAAYIKTLHEVGVPLDLKSLINLSNKKIKSQVISKKEEEYFNFLKRNMILFFEKAIVTYEKTKL